MSMIKDKALAIIILLLITSIAFAQNGSVDLKLGYVYLDDDGNESVSQSSFNYYDGPLVTLKDFNYRFKNGFRIESNLENINLENRNLFFKMGKSGTFGIKVKTNRYRRVYDFEGDSKTKRDLTSADLWFNPNRYVKFFAGGSFNSLSGEIEDSFTQGLNSITKELDYLSSKYSVGARVKYRGRMFHAEYNTISYSDQIDDTNDQTRNRYTLMGHLPVPDHEWLILSGVLRRFTTEYDNTEFGLESTTAKGSVLARTPWNITLNYIAFFNRAESDSDFVATDNVAHLIYATYMKPSSYGVTAGYQNDVNDDFEDEVKANSYYLAGWLQPQEYLELNAEYGSRAEEVEEGFRLFGNEDRSRVKVYGTYKRSGMGSFRIGFENKMRKNDQIGSEAEYNRYHFDVYVDDLDLFTVGGGYSYSKGEYENNESRFEFNSQQVYANVNTREYKGLTGGFGLTYFRNKLDLDDESINLLFKGSYSFLEGNRAEVVYRVFNFDNFMFLDQYYTENIVEFNLIKSLSF
jgi:hypothetical protein